MQALKFELHKTEQCLIRTEMCSLFEIQIKCKFAINSERLNAREDRVF